MYLLSTTEVSTIAGGIDSVTIGTIADGYVIVSTIGVSDQCAVPLANGLNWALEHPSVITKANPYYYSIKWNCTQNDLDNFLQNFDRAFGD